MWPDNQLRDLFSINLPIIQAPMAGSSSLDMAVAVSAAGRAWFTGLRDPRRRSIA